jgi:hypothetical protein
VELDSDIDKLYGVPLDEFVHDRDELAKRLRREGEREAAERIKKLRKPSAGAWALNQAVRRRRKETEALLAAGERLRAAHESLLSGGDQAELREAMQAERELVSGLADCAEAIASETGKSGPALRERVRSTLHAAAVDEEAREELTAGRFVREREAVGLGTFGAAPAIAPGRARTKRAGEPAEADRSGRAPAKAGKGGRAATGDGASARGRSATRAKAGSAGAASARAKERTAAERKKAAERERREQVATAERAVKEARAALGEAEASHADAAGELQAAREAVGAAEDTEREARAVARERRRALGKLERELERLRARKR